jgi:hypothetical protein
MGTPCLRCSGSATPWRPDRAGPLFRYNAHLSSWRTAAQQVLQQQSPPHRALAGRTPGAASGAQATLHTCPGQTPRVSPRPQGALCILPHVDQNSTRHPILETQVRHRHLADFHLRNIRGQRGRFPPQAARRPGDQRCQLSPERGASSTCCSSSMGTNPA